MQATGLALPVGDLEAAASINRAEINAEAAQQPEVSAVVSALEAQYDAMAPRIAIDEVDTSAPILNLPSAEEIGARLEAFLEANAPGTGPRLEPRPRGLNGTERRQQPGPARPVIRLMRV